MSAEQQLLIAQHVSLQTQETCVLCVGAEGTSKHDLSLAILKIPVKFSLQIRTASSLPLPEENADTRPRIDFICFLINMADRDSIQVVEKSLSLVDIRYFLGRACLLVGGAHSHKRMTDIEQVTALSDSYNLPLVFGDIKVEKERDQLARRILCMVEIAAGFKEGVSPSVIDSTKYIST
ncbi:centromere protein M-like isoform X2 [Littorina saxatilis]|uniref:Centromere protein M n=1 Tax=Littorina saxatilis TaxID=31220 RepID=A0AAN9AJZ6_9CAEN